MYYHWLLDDGFTKKTNTIMEIIHIVLGKANPLRMNGVNKVVHELATKQALAAYHVQIWGIAKDTTHNYPERNFKTKIFAKSKNPFAINAELKKEIVAKKGKAVFHLHGGFIPTFYAIAMWLSKHKIPFVTMTHGAYNTLAMEKNKTIKQIYFSLLEKKLLKAASFIHCIGQSEIDGLQRIYPNNKTVLIPYGFDMPLKISTNTNHTNENKFIIGFCGRIDVYTKGLNELLEAFASFTKTISNTQLWIIGDGKEKAELETKAKLLQIENKIVFWGSKFGDEKIELLQQCNMFASPSRNEGLPAAVLEAASLGIPCLVTEATNLGKAISTYKAGYVISATNSTLIYEALVELNILMKEMNREEQLKQNAKKMVAEYFNWDNTLDKLQQVYAAALQLND